MFEEMTYDNILARMLSNVPDTVDKREGSVIFDALSPAALEMANMAICMDIILSNSFAETAEREYLILRAKERGLVPYEATKALLKLEATYNGGIETIQPGDRFNLDDLNYIVTEQITDGETPIFGEWKAECETAGVVGNVKFGNLLPIETIQGLASARLTELLIPGEDTEGTEEFRQRYWRSFKRNHYGGNRADYIEYVSSIEGVGQVRAYRTPQGGGTVKVVITDSQNKVPSEELINIVKENLDPAGFTGLGEGWSPIGHSVTVTGPEKRIIDFNVSYETEVGAVVNKSQIETAVNAYVDDVNSHWAEKSVLRLYAAQLTAKLLDINGIINVNEINMSGSTDTLISVNDELFVVGEVTVICNT